MKIKNNVVKTASAGILMGLGCILPGVSGGNMAVAFGLYRKMIDAIANYFKNMKSNTLFLLPIALGGAVGVFCGSFLLDNILSKFFVPVMYLFIGFIAGGIPSLVKEANSESGFKKSYIVAGVVGAVIASMLLFIEKSGGSASISSALSSTGSLNGLQALLSGTIIAVGAIVPGISTSFILIYLGWYKPLMNAISDLNIITLIYIAVGACVCALLIIKIVNYIFTKVIGYAYYAVLGFLCVSIALIFPGFPSGIQLAVSTGLLIIGLLCSVFIGRINDNINNEEVN